MAGLTIASLVLAGRQLGWIPLTETMVVAVTILCTGAAMQAVAAVFAFASRDGGSGTTMGLLAAGWAVSGLGLLLGSPGSTSPALGTALLGVGALLLLLVAVLTAKLAAAVAVGLAGARFALTGVHQVAGSAAWAHIAGIVGLAVVAVGGYAAVALALADEHDRAVLPVGRRGAEANRPSGLAGEPGVRPSL